MRLSLLPFILFSNLVVGQTNLVSNGSFETYLNCPYSSNILSPDQVSFAVGWSASQATPDYFNSCAPNTGSDDVSVPYNFVGYQAAFDGTAYCGLGAYDYIGSRELISSKLNLALTIGQTYSVSFRAAVATNPFAGLGANNIGVCFTTYPCGFNLGAPPISNFAHIYSSNIISDTVNWTLVSGIICADSTYEYITLGNFFDNNHTDTIAVIPNMNIAYFYIDDIRIYDLGTVCSVGYDNNAKWDQIIDISPNPTYEHIHISSTIKKLKYKIKQISGEIIQNGVLNEQAEISFNLIPGLYFIEIYNETFSVTKKIVVLK